MSDIFISYASADRERAKVIAEALAARGWSVWWDRVIPPGREFDEVIEEALDASRCVVVLWSQTSVASRWVKTEAAEAMSRKALIPAVIEPVKIPLEFRRLQAADLSQWDGDPDDPHLEEFFRAVEAELGRAREPGGGDRPGPPRRPQPKPLPEKRSRKLPFALLGIAIAALVAVLGGGYYVEYSKNAERERAERRRAEQEEADRARRAEDERRAAEERKAAGERKAAEERKAADARRAAEERRAAEQRRAEEERRASEARRQATTAPSTTSRPGATQSVPASGRMSVSWRDHVLGFRGTFSWTPSSALLQVNAIDLKTGAAVGKYSVPAMVSQVAPTDYVVSAQFAVPGDSTTPGPHTHYSRLYFKAQQDGSVRLLQNCPRPGECY